MRFAEKRQQVVFAQAEKFDVFYHHHFIVRDAECRAVQNLIHALVITAGQKLQRFFVALRRLAQSFAVGIFADQADNFSDVRRDGPPILPFAIGIVQQQFFGGGWRWLGQGVFLHLFPAILEAVVGSLFHTNRFESGVGERFQALENFNAQIFCGRHGFAKRGNLILQRSMIERFYYISVYKSVEVREIRDHSRPRIDRSGHAHFHRVVVAVPVGIVTLAVDARIFFFAELRAVQPVRRREMIAPAELDMQRFRHHAAPFAPLR